MDSPCFHLPVDFESRNNFRMLERQVGDKLKAVAMIAVLWRDLSYAAENGRPGFLPDQQAPLYLDAVKNDKAIELLGGFLVREDGGWFCAQFAAENKHLSPNYASFAKQGGIARGVSKKRQRIEAEAVRHVGLLPLELWQKPDGKPMDDQEVRRTMMVIKLFDNYMGRPTRMTDEFTPGLIHDAFRALCHFEDKQIERVCGWLELNRETNNPAIPSTTEQLLKDLPTFMRVVLGES